MSKFLKGVFTIILVWSLFHLVRDIAFDIFGIQNAVLNFGHREYPGQYWCTPYCQFTTFPLEIFNIVVCVIVLKRNKVGILGGIVLGSLLLWLHGWLQGEGEFF